MLKAVNFFGTQCFMGYKLNRGIKYQQRFGTCTYACNFLECGAMVTGERRYCLQTSTGFDYLPITTAVGCKTGALQVALFIRQQQLLLFQQ
jgi:hypothetical protein